MTSYAPDIPVIETERLILRAPKLADLDRVTAFWSSDRSEIVGGTKNAHESARAMSAIFGSWALRGVGTWFIADRETDTFLGWAGYMNGPDWDEPEIGWTVTEDAEGKGIALEAAKAARKKLAEMGHDGLISYIREDNLRSAALASRLGAAFERDGTLLGTPIQIWRHPRVKEAN